MGRKRKKNPGRRLDIKMGFGNFESFQMTYQIYE